MTGVQEQGQARMDSGGTAMAQVWHLAGLVGLVGLGDALLWSVGAPRLALAVFAVIVVGAGQLARRLARGSEPSRGLWRVGWPLFLVSLLPVIEAVGLLSILFLLAGTAQIAAWIALGPDGTVSAALRLAPVLPVRGLVRAVADVLAIRPGGWMRLPGQTRMRGLLSDWGPSVGLGLVFVVLIGMANPVVDRWALLLGEWRPDVRIDTGRVTMWSFLAVMLWPFLRLAEMAPRGAKGSARAPRTGLIGERAAVRALVTFNALFAVQSGMDIAYLWGGVALPDGMTYASYAHRGAYPLVVTALLAGAFALALGTLPRHRRDLRLLLLLLWVGQTMLLVVSSLFRLDLYVDVYGLTRLRLAAAIWMALVAAGLALMLMQIISGRGPGWTIARSALIAVVSLWTVSLVNLDGLIARYNLERFGAEADMPYLCDLSRGALPALAGYPMPVDDGAPAMTALDWCDEAFPYYFEETDLPLADRIAPPQDWREWGFRNWRLRHSLAAMGEAQRPVTSAVPGAAVADWDQGGAGE